MGTFLYRSVVPLTLVSEDSVAGPQQKTSVEALQVDLSASLLCKVPKSVFICALLSSSISAFFFMQFVLSSYIKIANFMRCISLRPHRIEFFL